MLGFKLKKHTAPWAICYIPPLVRDMSLRVLAFVRFVYWSLSDCNKPTEFSHGNHFQSPSSVYDLWLLLSPFITWTNVDCWLIISEFLWHFHEGNCTGNGQDICPWYEFENFSFNSSRPSDAYMCRWTGSSLVQIMACHLFGAKPLSEPMLEYS